MLAAPYKQSQASTEMEQELADAYEGLYNLTRRMENEEEEQFDVDHAILDYVVYKTIDVVFKWQASTDRYQSDLPNSFVTMTAGKSSLSPDAECCLLT